MLSAFPFHCFLIVTIYVIVYGEMCSYYIETVLNILIHIRARILNNMFYEGMLKLHIIKSSARQSVQTWFNDYVSFINLLPETSPRA